MKLSIMSLIALKLCHITQAYFLMESYDYTNFFENFEFQAIPDPTHGTVQYVDALTAFSTGLANTTNKKIYLGVDSTTVLSSGGRKSIRLKSNITINGNNLVIIDLDHMPTTAGNILPKGCSLWPAFWTVGPSWPNNGEIDIIEYVNAKSTVLSALHTSNDCSMYSMNNSTFSGSFSSQGCYVNEPGQFPNSGCSIGSSALVGSKFNQNEGGVYAMEWVDDKYIRMFYFPRSSVPLDIIAKTPNPSLWGLPYARYDIGGCGSSCSSSHFQNHNIILNTALCGDWAGRVFGTCSTAMTCSSFVQKYPSEFTEAYWLINYVDVYNLDAPVAAPIVQAPITPTFPQPISALAYSLTSTYNASNFFNNFDFQTIADPGHGTVKLVDYLTAAKLGLAKYAKNKVFMGVDNTTVLTSTGLRNSLRIQSKRVLNGNNLVIIDLDHMPTTVGKILPQGCSVWPSFFSIGPSWPSGGEIDIITYVNRNANVSTSLHTSYGCDQYSTSTNQYTGYATTKNCDVNAAGQSANAGCGFRGQAASVGASFNQAGGGVYAMEWDTRQYIRMFYFPRGSIPQDIQNKKPDPSSWGLPYARFDIGSTCSGSKCTSDHFSNQKLTFGTSLCGDWAGNVFGSCSATMSCSSFVRNNPSEFTEAYWSINYVDIYDVPSPLIKSYVGCYGDGPSRAMDTFIATVTSIEQCYNLAIANDYQVFGVQWGNECWLSHNLNTTKRYGHCGQCTGTGCVNPSCNCAAKKCTSGEDCGDIGAYAVYQVVDSRYFIPPTVMPSVAPTFEPTAPTMIPTLTPTMAIHYQYLGCYGDLSASRAMTTKLGTVSSMLACYYLAYANGYSLYGLQYGGECWVSNNITQAEKYGQCGTCTKCGKPTCNCAAMKCSNGIDNCGDGSANSLYMVSESGISMDPPSLTPTFIPSIIPTISSVPSLTPIKPSYAPTASISYAYLGCYGDSTANRAMVKSLGTVSSMLACYSLALTNGYSLYGLQYGGQCWVSNNITKSEIYGQCGVCTKCGKPTCNCAAMKCSNGIDNCGDGSANNLYKITATMSPSFQPSVKPSVMPTRPTVKPSFQPSVKPTFTPSFKPSVKPSQPTFVPTVNPSVIPTCTPSKTPSFIPSNAPSFLPSLFNPSYNPSFAPAIEIPITHSDTFAVYSNSTGIQSGNSTYMPSVTPILITITRAPSIIPTYEPSDSPTSMPSIIPTYEPSDSPTNMPSIIPTYEPSDSPTNMPSIIPTYEPSNSPTNIPSITPTYEPSNSPTNMPSIIPTYEPSNSPTNMPSIIPTYEPSNSPTNMPSILPTSEPSDSPTNTPSIIPTYEPSNSPTNMPSIIPTYEPSDSPTNMPSITPTYEPSNSPTNMPSIIPTYEPSNSPTSMPSIIPTYEPSNSPTNIPSITPTYEPSNSPTNMPSIIPTYEPSDSPTNMPSIIPTYEPSNSPTNMPSIIPTYEPSNSPTNMPSITPTYEPSNSPTNMPSVIPTYEPSDSPTNMPSIIPTYEPSNSPTNMPSITPTYEPSNSPTNMPSITPTYEPSNSPTNMPSIIPTYESSGSPTNMPSIIPTYEPSISPTNMPSIIPTYEPSNSPTNMPSITPTYEPSDSPTNMPSIIPTPRPSCNPTNTPSVMPTIFPTTIPSTIPSEYPSSTPTYVPSVIPTPTPSLIPSASPIINLNVLVPILPTTSPTKAPISPSMVPTKAPISPSMVPTKAPLSKAPTKAPLSKAPTKAPLSKKPTKAPLSKAPTKAPSSKPTKAPLSKAPTKAPILPPTLTSAPI